MLRVEAISKWYLPPPPLLRPLVRVASRSPVQALKDVTMHVDQGEVLGLVGPNGAGKTTLIRVIATLLEPDDGTAHVHGFEVTRQPWEVRRHLGLVLEGDRGLYGRLTGRQNLEFFGVFAGLTPAVARQRATYWGLQGIRGALLTSVPPAALIEELAALLVFNALLLPLSLWAFGRAVRFCRVASTLADY